MTNILCLFIICTLAMEINGGLYGKINSSIIDHIHYSISNEIYDNYTENGDDYEQQAVTVLNAINLSKNTKDLLKSCPSKDLNNCDKIIKKLSKPKNVREQAANVLGQFFYHKLHLLKFCPVTDLMKCSKKFIEKFGKHNNLRKAIKSFPKIDASSTNIDTEYEGGQYLKKNLPNEHDGRRHNRRIQDGGILEGGHRVLQLVLVDTQKTFIYHEVGC